MARVTVFRSLFFLWLTGVVVFCSRRPTLFFTRIRVCVCPDSVVQPPTVGGQVAAQKMPLVRRCEIYISIQ